MLPRLIDIEIELEEIITAQTIAQKVQLHVARLDKIHSTVSGNKLFKLHYFLERAIATNKKIITYGGAYSNHLVATAFAAQNCGLTSVGIVRGEQPAKESTTLQHCRAYGMQLKFLSRQTYLQATNAPCLKLETNESVVIPEGGFHPFGAKGAALIMQHLLPALPTHVCVAVGTATTLAGLLSAAGEKKIVAFPVLKNMHDIPERIKKLSDIISLNSLVFKNEYHFGGYAKYTESLFGFMNDFYLKHAMPLDFVYTGKLFYGVLDQIDKGFFPAGSSIVCLHTGGLQGNNSLPAGKLVY